MDLNVEIFDSVGMAWDRLTPLSPEELATFRKRGFLEKARDLLHQKLEGGGIVALKHPGTAKIFPFWREVLSGMGCEVDYLLAVRHPLSVAKSLERRDGMPKFYGTLMWLAHVIPSLFVPPGSRVLVTDYDRLMSNPTGELERMATCFGLEVDPAESKKFREEFLDDGLRHSTFTVSDLENDSDLPRLLTEVYGGLLDLASDRTRLSDPRSTELFSRWAGEFDNFYPFLKFIETLSAKYGHQNILLDNATRELGWREASLSWRLTRPLRAIFTFLRKLFAR